MNSNRIALITGANQGMGKHLAKELVSDGTTVFLGSRDLGRGQTAAAELGQGAVAIQLDVTDSASIAAAASRIEDEAGRLDLLVNNAAISSTRTDVTDLAELRATAAPSVVQLDDIRAVWETNVFGPLAVYQAMLPLLRLSSDARVVNITSALGSLALASDPHTPVFSAFDPVYSASKTALNALTLTMMAEQETTGIKVNLVSPGFANTALVKFQGMESVEDATREVVRVARLGADGPHRTFTTWEGQPLPW